MQKATVSGRKPASGGQQAVCGLMLSALCLLPPARAWGQSKSENPKAQIESAQAPEGGEAPLAGDWAPELLDAILSAPNPEARDGLYRAAFAAGPAIVPQLEAALKDDRTAEFAAQALAFMGGSKAMEILSGLVNDRRDLDLRRFYYGALGEFQAPEAVQVLTDVIRRSDEEPDRTVTEAAILALTVRSDTKLVSALRPSEAQIKDVVIHDDLDNALDVIEARARYLASAEAKSAGGSLEQAVRIYFIPALEPPPGAPKPAPSIPSKVARAAPARPRFSGKRATPRQDSTPVKRPEPAESGVKVSIQNLTWSPDKMRALARVVFEDPSAVANYDMVLQKQYGNWSVASVWLGSEVEKTPPPLEPQPSPR
jgi:HEAT repeat protein